MKKTIIFLIFFIFFTQNSNLFANISEDQNIYNVTGIIVQEFGENLRILKSLAIESAKRKAFMELTTATQKDEIEITDIDIDLCVAGFTFENESFAHNEYNAVVTIAFDKRAVENLYRSKLEGKYTHDIKNVKKIELQIVVNNQEKILEKWSKIHNYIKNKKIEYEILSINSQLMIIELKELDIERLIKDFQEINIKTSTFSRKKYLEF